MSNKVGRTNAPAIPYKGNNTFIFAYIRLFKMGTSTVVSASFLCVFNVAFMIAGIFLHSAVIINLRRSSQLRKKLCYFMIFVLSCFDLGVVAIVNPIHISSTIPVLLGTYNDMQEHVRCMEHFQCNNFFFNVCTFCPEYRTCSGLNIPLRSSHISYETKTYISSGYHDDFVCYCVVIALFEQ